MINEKIVFETPIDGYPPFVTPDKPSHGFARNPTWSYTQTDFDKDGYQKMLCVESANIGKEEITLQSREQYIMKVFISI